MASVSIYVDEDLGANNDALAVSTPSRRAFGVLSANTPLRTPGSTRRGKAAIKAPISPLMKALETAKEPAKCTACESNATALSDLEAANTTLSEQVETLNVALINEREDCKQYQAEYNRIQSEGAALYQTYTAKCNRLKDVGAKCARLEEELRASEASLEAATTERDAAVEAQTEWQEKFMAQSADFQSRFAAYKTLRDEHAATVAEKESLAADLIAARASIAEYADREAAFVAAQAEHDAVVVELETAKAALEQRLEAIASAPEVCDDSTVPAASGEIFDLTDAQRRLLDAATAAYSPSRRTLLATSFDSSMDSAVGDLGDTDNHNDESTTELTDRIAFLEERLLAKEAVIQSLTTTPVATALSFDEDVAGANDTSLSAEAVDQISAIMATYETSIDLLEAEMSRKHALEVERLQTELANAQAETASALAPPPPCDACAAHTATIAALRAAVAEAEAAAAPAIADNDVLPDDMSPAALRQSLEAANIRNEVLRDAIATAESNLAEARRESAAASSAASAALDSVSSLKAQLATATAKAEAQVAEHAVLTAALKADTAAAVARVEADLAAATAALEAANARAASASELEDQIGLLTADLAAASEATAVREAELGAQIEALSAKVTGLTTVNATLENDLVLTYKKHKADLAALTAEYQNGDYEARYEALVAENRGLEDRLASAEALVDEVEAYDARSDELFAVMDAKAGELRDRLTALVKREEVLAAGEAELKVALAGAADERATLDTAIADFEAQRSDARAEIEAVSGILASAQQARSAAEARIAELEDEVLGWEARAATVEEEAASAAATLETQTAAALEATAQVETLSNQIAGLRDEVTALSQSLFEAEERAAVAEASAEEAEAAIARLTGDLEAVRAETAETNEFMRMEREELERNLAEVAAEVAAYQQTVVPALEDQLRQAGAELANRADIVHELEEEGAAADAAHEAEVADLRTRLSAGDAVISELSSDLAAAEARADDLSASLATAQASAADLQTAKEVLETQLEATKINAAAIQDQCARASARVMALTQEVSAKEMAAGSLNIELLGKESRISELTAALEAAKRAAAAGDATTTELRTRIAALEASVAELQAALATARGEIASLEAAKVSAAAETARLRSALETETEAHTAAYGDKCAELARAKSALDQAAVDVSGLEYELETAQAKVKALQDEVAAVGPTAVSAVNTTGSGAAGDDGNDALVELYRTELGEVKTALLAAQATQATASADLSAAAGEIATLTEALRAIPQLEADLAGAAEREADLRGHLTAAEAMVADLERGVREATLALSIAEAEKNELAIQLDILVDAIEQSEAGGDQGGAANAGALADLKSRLDLERQVSALTASHQALAGETEALRAQVANLRDAATTAQSAADAQARALRNDLVAATAETETLGSVLIGVEELLLANRDALNETCPDVLALLP